MVGGQLCRQTYRVRHREERCKNQRQYNKEHRDALMVTKRKRDEYIDRIVQAIELNDDPESLFYAGDFEEATR